MASKPDAPAAMGTSHSMVAGVDLSVPCCQQGVSIFAHSQSANTGSMVLISFPQANCHLTKQIALWLDEFCFLIQDVSDSLGSCFYGNPQAGIPRQYLSVCYLLNEFPRTIRLFQMEKR